MLANNFWSINIHLAVVCECVYLLISQEGGYQAMLDTEPCIPASCLPMGRLNGHTGGAELLEGMPSHLLLEPIGWVGVMPQVWELIVVYITFVPLLETPDNTQQRSEHVMLFQNHGVCLKEQIMKY